jgi:hypothetical protein
VVQSPLKVSARRPAQCAVPLLNAHIGEGDTLRGRENAYKDIVLKVMKTRWERGEVLVLVYANK